jgi:hypothetical protein
VERRTGVSRASLQRWKTEEGWDELRDQHRALELESRELALQMTRAARESQDPQQAYAAMQAARLAGLAEAPVAHPAPGEVAKAILVVLDEDPELGPVLRRKRKLVIERILERVEMMEARS